VHRCILYCSRSSQGFKPSKAGASIQAACDKTFKPLVITGIPRSGTTALHLHLAMDPRFQGLNHWLTEVLQPWPPRSQWECNAHFKASVQGLQAMYRRAPALKRTHHVEAGDVDECLEVLMQEFVGNRFASMMAIDTYDRWWQEQNELVFYRRYLDVLRLIGANEPEKTWLLKNPGHIY
jgi:hypothetical protein